MLSLNFMLCFATAIIPLLTGFVWYNPKIFGTAWMNTLGYTEESLRKDTPNMALIIGLTYLCGLFASVGLVPVVIHQMGFFQSLESPELKQSGSALAQYAADYMSKYGNNFRGFGHGALHGAITGFFLVGAVVTINALFERRNFKYIAIHVGYWMLTLALIGGVLCQFM
jgi:hypothetical protein